MDFASTRLGQEYCSRMPRMLKETAKEIEKMSAVADKQATALDGLREQSGAYLERLDKQNEILGALVQEMAALREELKWLSR